MYNTIQEFFEVAMSRSTPLLVEPLPEGIHLNLGAGTKKKVPGNPIPLDLPDWDAMTDRIPYSDGTVSVIHAYHFLEHLENPIHCLAECQRVLMHGGVMYIVVPYYNSQLQALSVTHKRAFCEDTLKNLFTDDYYNIPGAPRNGWEFLIGLNIIIGLVERNLCLLTQLIRE